MPDGLIKFGLHAAKWVSMLVAGVLTIVTILFVRDLLGPGRWGYPWWLGLIFVATVAVASLLYREASVYLKEIAERDATR